ncbi:MAG: hypothetical protein ACRD6N_00835, partial [Pyrinomonadaceae bacterium]
MEIKTTKLTDNVYLLEGAGGNVAAFVWDGRPSVMRSVPPRGSGWVTHRHERPGVMRWYHLIKPVNESRPNGYRKVVL